MLKMLMEPMGGIVTSKDVNAILHEMEVPHPAAKSMIEISQAPGEEVANGTTSVSVFLLDRKAKREQGRKVQICNIRVAKTVADILRTCLGPRAMLKMLMEPMGGIVTSKDVNAILHEMEVPHPAAK
eukprot:Colp12_sorted_trinity150504_noHs@16527